VSDPDYLELMAGALAELGCRRALVVSGEDGMDEVSIVGPTRVVEVSDGRIEAYTVAPEDVGLTRADPSSLRGGTPAENAEISRRVLQGEAGPRRELAVINAGAALLAAGAISNLAEGVRMAERAIDAGEAQGAMERFVSKTVELAPVRQA
jgi:anthranilate phosphoribosyltransferase